MNAASIDIKDSLEDAGLGLIYKKNLFIGKQPASPDDCVTVIDTPSFTPDNTLDNVRYYRSSVMVQVRNNGYTAGMVVARNVMDWLHGRANSTWNSTLYTVIQATGEPAPLAWDENDRTIIIINFNLQRR